MAEIEPARQKKLLENFQSVAEKISAACARSGRPDRDAELLAVVKYADPGEVRFLAEAGKIRKAGENKVQDAFRKWSGGELAEARRLVELHFIGHLQTNKSADAVELFDWIDSVDSLKLANHINRHAEARNKKMPVLIQVKLTDTGTQGGISPAEAPALLAEMRKLSFLLPRGYMAIAPANAAPVSLRPVFREMKKIFDRDFPAAADSAGAGNYLSLGMSGDFETAVEEGANLPRIGSLLFA